jgi:diguanylate cyclase (GGDEF)-like protein/PAS domain S-box-containing protein
MSRPANSPIRHEIDSDAAFARMARVLAAAMPAAVILLAGEDTTGSVRPLTHWRERQGEDISAAVTSSIDSDIVEIGGHLAPVLRSRRFGPCGATLQVIVLGSIPERAFNARDAALLDDFVDMAAPKLASASVAQTPEITELKRREESARLLFESHPLPMLVIDVETLVILDVNAASVAFYGYSRDEMLALRLPDIRPEKTSGEIGWYLDNADDAEVADRPRIHRLKSGEERVVRVSMQIVERDGRKVILAAFYDITERQKMEAEVLRTRAFLRHVVDTIPVAVFVKDMRDDGRYVLYNKTGQDVLGFDGASVIGNFDTDLFDPEVVAEFRRQDEETLKRGAYDFVEETFATGRDHQVRFIRTRKVALKDGADGKARYVLGISEDITEQRVREREIAHLAHHDSLTGLPNRFQFESRMAPAVTSLAETNEQLAVFFIDLDGFKAVNDTFGHSAGDVLLCGVARRLEETVRSGDLVARFGGDEFAVLATIHKPGEAAWIAARLVNALSMDYHIDGEHVRISASIGIALASNSGETVGSLMQCADGALYEAKRAGKNRFIFGSPKPATKRHTADAIELLPRIMG